MPAAAALMTLREASLWASRRFGREITASNISYLVQYGRVAKFDGNGKGALVARGELERYYRRFSGQRRENWARRLGGDVNWRLSFEGVKEAETTKHVHRLHPYKGKFIPQLAGYFLDAHTDDFKREALFRPGDIVLDPFCGSGTTLVQAAELNLHAVGCDISAFNAMMSNIKVARFDLAAAERETAHIGDLLRRDSKGVAVRKIEEELLGALREFNEKHFPSPAYKRRVRAGEIDEDAYGAKRAAEFLPLYRAVLRRRRLVVAPLGGDSFLDEWCLAPVRREIEIARTAIEKIADSRTRALLQLILSRTVRSCRATTHADLATLKSPVSESYYCAKHGKMCKPLFSILGWWDRYAADSIARLCRFDALRTSARQYCIAADSRSADIFAEVNKKIPALGTLCRRQKIRGIFSSPPYVGLIDYHEQHAYAYELFGFARRDELEIGALAAGRSKAAREKYAADVAAVLTNCRRFMVDDFDVFLVANDKFGVYPDLAQRAGMRVYKEYKRPVLNRSEGDKGAYAESIFHLKRNKENGVDC